LTVSKSQARLMIVATAILWSTGGAAIKLSTLDAPAIAAGRAFFAAIVLFALLPEARLRPTRTIVWTSIAYALTCSLFVIANRLTTAGHAIFIQNTAPVWVLLLGPRLLGEKPTKAEIYSVPVGLIGCGLVFADHLGEGRLAGDLCALAASFSYAVLIMLYKKTTVAESMSATVLGNGIIVAVMLPIAITFGGPPVAIDWAVLIYLGVLQQAVAATLFVRGIRHVSALEASLLTLLEPLFSPIWAFLMIGETMGPLAIGGALLIAVSTVFRTVTSARSD